MKSSVWVCIILRELLQQPYLQTLPGSCKKDKGRSQRPGDHSDNYWHDNRNGYSFECSLSWVLCEALKYIISFNPHDNPCYGLNRVFLQIHIWTSNPEYLMMWLYLEIWLLQMELVNMRSCFSKVIQYNECPYYKGKLGDRHTQGRMPSEDKGRDGMLLLEAKEF